MTLSLDHCDGSIPIRLFQLDPAGGNKCLVAMFIMLLIYQLFGHLHKGRMRTGAEAVEPVSVECRVELTEPDSRRRRWRGRRREKLGVADR